jgi:hypothetical protein
MIHPPQYIANPVKIITTTSKRLATKMPKPDAVKIKPITKRKNAQKNMK